MRRTWRDGRTRDTGQQPSVQTQCKLEDDVPAEVKKLLGAE